MMSRLTKAQAFSVIVEATALLDLEALIETIRLTHRGPDTICAPSDVPLVRAIATIVARLLESYSFIDSPAFQSQVLGRSEAYRTMKARFEKAPEKRAAHRARFLEVLAQLPNHDTAFSLLAHEQHPQLDRLQVLCRSLSNPD